MAGSKHACFKLMMKVLLFKYQVLTNLPSMSVAQVEQEPGLVCCGGGALFVVATGGCKVKMNYAYF